MSCREFALDDVAAITAIPLTKYTETDTLLSPVINTFSPVFDASTIVIGQVRQQVSGSGVGSLIPLISSSASVKDTETLGVAGRAHTSDVECEVDDRDADVWQTIQTIERAAHHLILLCKSGDRFFVRASEDTYTCTTSRDGKKTSLSFKIHSLMGLQKIA